MSCGQYLSVLGCWQLGTITLTPFETEMKSPVIDKTVRFVLLLEVFFFPYRIEKEIT